MARWKLLASHYLNVPGTEWEQRETSRETGKEVRKRYFIPRLLNIEDPGDWTEKYRNDLGQVFGGDIIVCFAGRGQPKDIVFEGLPTPDMEPLDEEAEAISAQYRDGWVHPIESLPAQGDTYGAALIAKMEQVMSMMIQAQGGATSTAFTPAVSPDSQLVEQLLHKVQELTIEVGKLKAGAIPEDIEPLSDIEPTEAELAESEKAAQVPVEVIAAKGQASRPSLRRG
jgi:hypothetical protein